MKEAKDYLKKFGRLPYLKMKILPPNEFSFAKQFEVADDGDGYVPTLYHYLSKWHVSYIHCLEQDCALDFAYDTPEECIDKAYEFCVTNSLIK